MSKVPSQSQDEILVEEAKEKEFVSPRNIEQVKTSTQEYGMAIQKPIETGQTIVPETKVGLIKT